MPEQIVELKRRGESLTRVGIPICKGPATYRLMLTWPEEREGRVIEIPHDQIASIATAEERPRGKEPAPANT